MREEPMFFDNPNVLSKDSELCVCRYSAIAPCYVTSIRVNARINLKAKPLQLVMCINRPHEVWSRNSKLRPDSNMLRKTSANTFRISSFDSVKQTLIGYDNITMTKSTEMIVEMGSAKVLNCSFCDGYDVHHIDCCCVTCMLGY